MTVRMTEQELRELVKDKTLEARVVAQAWDRLRALARRPTASLAVCDDESELGREILRRRVNPDWLSDETMSRQETLRRFEALNPKPTRGPRSPDAS